jgi:probable HAF family extracellular repeat protein
VVVASLPCRACRRDYTAGSVFSTRLTALALSVGMTCMSRWVPRAFALATVIALPAWPQTYTVQYIGALTPHPFVGEAVNSSGQVAGYAETGDGTLHAFLYSGGTATDLGTLPGFSDTLGQAISDTGAVAGVASNSSSTANGHAFLHADGTLKDLGALPGGQWSEAFAVNVHGDVAGLSDTANGTAHAFLFSNGIMTDLGGVSGESWATAINANGDIAGYVYTGQADQFGPVTHAVVWRHGALQDLGTLGGSSSAAFAINDAGQIAGSSGTGAVGQNGTPVVHAFLFSNGVMMDLGTLGGQNSAGKAIDAAGDVAGYADSPTDQRGFVYSGGVMRDLDTLTGDPFVAVVAIASSGVILAQGTRPTDILGQYVISTPGEILAPPAPPPPSPPPPPTPPVAPSTVTPPTATATAAAPAQAPRGGGGAFDLFSVLALGSLFTLRGRVPPSENAIATLRSSL